MKIELSIETRDVASQDVAILEAVAQLLGGKSATQPPAISQSKTVTVHAKVQPEVDENLRVNIPQRTEVNAAEEVEVPDVAPVTNADIESARRAIKAAFDRSEANKGLMRQKYIALGGTKLSDLDPKYYAVLISYANSL